MKGHRTIVIVFIMILGMITGCGKKEETKTGRRIQRTQKAQKTIGRTIDEQRRFDKKLEDIRKWFQGYNVPMRGQQPTLGSAWTYDIVVDKTGTLSEYASAFYDDIVALTRQSNGQIRGLKVAMDLTARANDIKKDVNDVSEGRMITWYSMGCFDFYIPPIDRNKTNLFSRIMTDQIIFVKGEIVK